MAYHEAGHAIVARSLGVRVDYLSIRPDAARRAAGYVIARYSSRLLVAIAEHLAKNKYDLKALMRLILRSETYRRSSVPLERNREDQSYYSRYYPRRMMAEVLYDAIVSVTSV